MQPLAVLDAAQWGFLGVTVTGLFALVGTIITQQKTRQENRADHGTVRDALIDLRADVSVLRAELGAIRETQIQHMRWHLDDESKHRGDGR